MRKEKLMLKYARLSIYGKRKRIRGKSYKRIISLAGYNPKNHIKDLPYARVGMYFVKVMKTNDPKRKFRK